ncbi:MAG: DUF934 domain-containing protein [Proteobacteria bacterium]|nr:DUF934 domain-containing protein [Pseudomonadota bacterium]MDA1325036.1 DUF934 domain-containing protein [Pseudomonadota bacterium]
MALLKRDRIVDDPWQRMDDESPLPSGIPVIVTYERWQRERDELVGRNGELGIVLASDQSPDLIADDLHRFTLICLEFPKFTDGRAYSYARLLRARYDFAGEIRAVGAVLRDQLLFMRRCGFDSFDIPDGVDAADWTIAFNDFSQRYQPTVDRTPTVTQLRLEKGYIAPGPHRGSDVAGSWSY